MSKVRWWFCCCCWFTEPNDHYASVINRLEICPGPLILLLHLLGLRNRIKMCLLRDLYHGWNYGGCGIRSENILHIKGNLNYHPQITNYIVFFCILTFRPLGISLLSLTLAFSFFHWQTDVYAEYSQIELRAKSKNIHSFLKLFYQTPAGWSTDGLDCFVLLKGCSMHSCSSALISVQGVRMSTR